MIHEIVIKYDDEMGSTRVSGPMNNLVLFAGMCFGAIHIAQSLKQGKVQEGGPDILIAPPGSMPPGFPQG